MNKLEKIDMIRERLNVSYSRANEALEENDGDVVSAIIMLEDEMKNSKKNFEKENIHVMGNELMEKLKELIHEGNIKKITIKNEKGESILEIPVTAGVVGLVLFPYIGILGGMAAMLKEYKLEISRDLENENNDLNNENNDLNDSNV
ncbi:MAG: DUF4342 domain-containing protein [Bacillota bacterium]